jgi:KDO2-lipid IV(A) lauroyltransferase
MERLGWWCVYALVRGFFLALCGLPRSLAYRFCEALALLVYTLDRKHRRIGLVNLRIAFPEHDEQWRRRVLRRSFLQFGGLAVELSRLHRFTRDDFERRFPYEPGYGLENYLDARSSGRGVLFLTAHVSAWEVLPAAHAARGYPLSFVVRPLDNPILDEWVTRLRSLFGNKPIDKRASVRRILALLRKREDVGLLIDQNIQAKEGVFVPFFGRPACTSPSLAALALKTGAPVVPGFIHPSGARKGYQLRFYPPIRVEAGPDQESDLIRYTAEFNRYIERMIREFPHCWIWGHRRFQTQPDGSNPY